MKGGASYCGTTLLYKLCSQLETAIKQNEQHHFLSLYNLVIAELPRIKSELQKHMSNTDF